MKICSLVQEQQRAMFIEKCSWKCKIAFWCMRSFSRWLHWSCIPPRSLIPTGRQWPCSCILSNELHYNHFWRSYCRHSHWYYYLCNRPRGAQCTLQHYQLFCNWQCTVPSWWDNWCAESCTRTELWWSWWTDNALLHCKFYMHFPKLSSFSSIESCLSLTLKQASDTFLPPYQNLVLPQLSLLHMIIAFVKVCNPCIV